MNAVRDFIVGIGGESGEGIVLAGDILNTAASRMNIHTIGFRTFPAEARGGPSVVKLRLLHDHVYSLGDEYDVLLAFSEAAYNLHGQDLSKTGVLVIDGDDETPLTDRHPELEGRIVYRIPMERIARKVIGEIKTKNMVAIGASAALFGFSPELIEEIITERFKKRGEQMLTQNLTAFRAGLEHVRSQVKKVDPFAIEKVPGDGFLILSGNEAIALGALYAGCRFYGGYPITPATEIMEILAAELPRVGGVMYQAEDEIASIGMVLGASFTGVRSMTATSGPGLSLMAEMIGLASMTELPCVIVDVQRGGPSTGLPTKTEQGDLALALVATHGDAPHAVLAPITVRDCYEIMGLAFEIAETYQVPVIVLTDQALGFQRADLSKKLLVQRTDLTPKLASADLPEQAAYLRYRITENGVSPRAVPGMPGKHHVVTGLEHAEDGKPAYDPTTRRAMIEKRQRKMTGIARDFASVIRVGDPNPEIGIIGWGSTAGPVKEAVEILHARGVKVGAILPRMLLPSPNEQIRPFIESCKKVAVIEANLSGQYAAFLRSQIPGFDPIRYNRYDGMPITLGEVLRQIEEMAS